MSKKVIILGAGISGLTAGITLLEKGFDVTIIEKNNDVGGLCSGYFVNGHYIDACLHWLMGTNKKSSLYKDWVRIGALKKTKIISLPTIGTFCYEGTTVTFYRDLKKTEEELIKISPEDKRAIHRFIGAVRDMGTLMGVVFKNKHLQADDVLHTLPHSGHIYRCMKESRAEYAKRFKHPALRFAFENAQTGYNNMFFFLDQYGLFSTGNADIPEGGAHYMVQRIKSQFLKLGGELMLDTLATKIVTENDKAVAIETDKGVVTGDHFISTIDPRYTLDTLLDGKYRIHLFERLEKSVAKRSISSCFCVYVTVEGDLSHINVPTILQTNTIQVGSRQVNAMLVRPYSFDPKHFVKDGKTVVCLFIDQNQDDYNYFASLDKKHYDHVTSQTIEAMMNAFLAHYPEFKGKVEFLDFFGPMEIKRRSNTSYGSIQSYSFTGEGNFYLYSGKFNEVDNLYLCGQRNRAIGGTPTALLTAVEICKQFDKKGRKTPLSGIVSFHRKVKRKIKKITQ